MVISNELGERVDVLEWSEDPAKYITGALSPAKITNIDIQPKKEAIVYVPYDQLSLAIGKGGQNVRLAAKITGWKIDVRSQDKPEESQDGGAAESKVEARAGADAEATERPVEDAPAEKTKTEESIVEKKPKTKKSKKAESQEKIGDSE